jgi:hypothetical protein
MHKKADGHLKSKAQEAGMFAWDRITNPDTFDVSKALTPEQRIKTALTIMAPTLLGAGIGGAVGATRKTDEGESRLRSIPRSARTGATTGTGVSIGALTGATIPTSGAVLAGVKDPKILAGIGTAGSLAGAVTGALAGHKLSKRDKKDKKMETASKEQKEAFLVNRTDQLAELSHNMKEAAKDYDGPKQTHPLTTALISALLSGGASAGLTALANEEVNEHTAYAGAGGAALGGLAGGIGQYLSNRSERKEWPKVKSKLKEEIKEEKEAKQVFLLNRVDGLEKLSKKLKKGEEIEPSPGLKQQHDVAYGTAGTAIGVPAGMAVGTGVLAAPLAKHLKPTISDASKKALMHGGKAALAGGATTAAIIGYSLLKGRQRAKEVAHERAESAGVV